ncbi:MAG: DUF928 domain-containing protein [Spirulina sp. SIO3F2]|nr:DUF928 domain-containing protein [Spirulina sp. SIO3F2]
MLFSKSFKTNLLLLSALGFGMGAIVPLPSDAISFPSSTPSSGAPPRTASGAPRRSGYCEPPQPRDLNGDGVIDKLTPMTAITPTNNTISSFDKNPTFFIYLPESPANTAVISVYEKLDGSPEKEVYFNDTLTVPRSIENGPRIAAYTLSDFALKPGRTYKWSFSLSCENEEHGLLQIATIGHVEGIISCQNGCSIESKVPDLNQLTDEEVMQTALSYAKQGFWDETVSLTAQLRQSNPEQWLELLDSQGLACFAEVPFSDESDVDFTIEDDPQCFVD